MSPPAYCIGPGKGNSFANNETSPTSRANKPLTLGKKSRHQLHLGNATAYSTRLGPKRSIRLTGCHQVSKRCKCTSSGIWFTMFLRFPTPFGHAGACIAGTGAGEVCGMVRRPTQNDAPLCPPSAFRFFFFSFCGRCSISRRATSEGRLKDVRGLNSLRLHGVISLSPRFILKKIGPWKYRPGGGGVWTPPNNP